jgi:hypothetical protein
MALFLLSNCKTDKKTSGFSITPPFPKFNPAFTVFEVNTDNDDTLEFASGTKIMVPAHIWVDSAGNEISGQIELKYREFHRAEDIFLAGIPMLYDSANTKQILTTSGMYEIRAFQNGKSLNINKGKSLTVRLASHVAGSDYNFYTLNDSNGNWQYAGTANPEINTDLTVIKETIKNLEAKNKYPFDKNTTFTLSYEAALDIFFNNNYDKINNNYNNKGIQRKIEAYGVDWTKIYDGRWTELKYKGIRFYAWEMLWKTTNNQKLPSWLKSKNCGMSDFKSLGNNKYMIKVDDYGKNKLTLYVEAVMPLKVLFSLTPDARQEDYDKVLEEIRQEKERLAMQAEVYRTFSVNSIGTHNWDMVYHRKNVIVAKADFKFDTELEKGFTPRIYYFLDSNRSFVEITNWQSDSIMLDRNSTCKYVAVLSSNKGAIFNSTQYNALDFDKIKEQKNISFELKSFDITNIEDIKKILN